MKKYQVISNATPLIAFIKKNELSTLKLLFEKISIPRAVYNEITNVPNGFDEEKEIVKREIGKNWIIIKDVGNMMYTELNLGTGETESINLCMEHENPLLLIDEKQGRNIAKALKLNILGTMGIFLLCYRRNLKTKEEILKNLNALIEHGFYLSSEVVLHFINELEK